MRAYPQMIEASIGSRHSRFTRHPEERSDEGSAFSATVETARKADASPPAENDILINSLDGKRFVQLDGIHDVYGFADRVQDFHGCLTCARG